MRADRPFRGREDYLRRLPPEYYRGRAYVHWSLSIEDRRTGWLIPAFYYKFRELLTHASYRYALCCPVFCCMPDHIHLLWVGVLDESDQLLAMRYFRKHLNLVLDKVQCKLQNQAYDHVLREEELERTAFEEVVEYIARNPERKGLVEPGGFRAYPYTNCLVPGYPELTLWQPDYWERFWRVYAYLRENGLSVARTDGSA